jgi:hypothetical protein
MDANEKDFERILRELHEYLAVEKQEDIEVTNKNYHKEISRRRFPFGDSQHSAILFYRIIAGFMLLIILGILGVGGYFFVEAERYVHKSIKTVKAPVETTFLLPAEVKSLAGKIDNLEKSLDKRFPVKPKAENTTGQKNSADAKRKNWLIEAAEIRNRIIRLNEKVFNSPAASSFDFYEPEEILQDLSTKKHFPIHIKNELESELLSAMTEIKRRQKGQ